MGSKPLLGMNAETLHNIFFSLLNGCLGQAAKKGSSNREQIFFIDYNQIMLTRFV
jgi:hypothetical protein